MESVISPRNFAEMLLSSKLVLQFSIAFFNA